MRELEARAAAGGTRVLSGDCVELGEGELAYAPLVTALRPLVRDRDPVLADLPADITAELATLLPGLGAARERARGAGDQGRVFEALLAVLDGLTREAPGPAGRSRTCTGPTPRRARSCASSRRRSAASRCSCSRPTGRTSCTGATRCARCWPSSSGCARCASTSPGSRATSSQSSSPTSSAPRPTARCVDRLYARSEGNPLFAEELLAAGLDGLGAVPPSLAAALALRIERLGDDAQEIVRVLSAGGQLDDAVLAEVSGLDRRALREGVREAVGSHIVVLEGDRYTLRHALVREAVHDELLPGERAELHRALARALEQDSGPSRAPSAPRRSRTTTPPRATSPPRWPPPCAPAPPRCACRPTARARRSTSARWSCGTACRTRPA